jgi:hypothetical protein
MKSLYKNLVVSGCSFTHEPHNEWYPFAWPSIFAEDTKMTVTNLAMPGAGNEHIARSIILHLEKNRPNRDDTLVIAMWTGIGRFDWITDASLSNFKDLYPFTYAYDMHNELVLAGNWWNLRKGPALHEALLQYSKYQSDYSFAVTSWLAMKNLSNYLCVNGYRHYFTSFVDYKRNKIKGDGLVVPFHDTLSEIGLQIDTQNWMALADDDHYGDWALKNDAVDHNDGFHPRFPEANEGWVRQVLVPYFFQEGILQNNHDPTLA